MVLEQFYTGSVNNHKFANTGLLIYQIIPEYIRMSLMQASQIIYKDSRIYQHFDHRLFLIYPFIPEYIRTSLIHASQHIYKCSRINHQFHSLFVTKMATSFSLIPENWGSYLTVFSLSRSMFPHYNIRVRKTPNKSKNTFSINMLRRTWIFRGFRLTTSHTYNTCNLYVPNLVSPISL